MDTGKPCKESCLRRFNQPPPFKVLAVNSQPCSIWNDMRWEDQELNHATSANQASRGVCRWTFLDRIHFKESGQYIQITQNKLDEMIRDGTLNKKTAGARMSPDFILHSRLCCRLGPGGGHYPTLGITHFWQDSVSCYAILYFSPKNDWLKIMAITAPPPS